jgi:hypothetical protein
MGVGRTIIEAPFRFFEVEIICERLVWVFRGTKAPKYPCQNSVEKIKVLLAPCSPVEQF